MLHWLRPCYFSCDGFYSGMSWGGGGGKGGGGGGERGEEEEGKGGEGGNLKILKGGRLAMTSSEN